MKICVIGGGINGLCCAWELAQQGYAVTLYERGKLAKETSQASSKLLHGGLRYLEQGRFRLVQESLQERDAWLQRVPALAKPLRLVLPIYRQSRRKRSLVGVGLYLYDHLAGRSILPASTWVTASELLKADPYLQPEGLTGGYAFYDGQMDDYRLALWVAEQAKQVGAQIIEDAAVQTVDSQGNVYFLNHAIAYDRVINVCGPWAKSLLEKSSIFSSYQLDAVRGSHLVIRRDCPQAYLLEIPNENRIFFVLPWKGNTLLGTTEIRQQLNEAIECSAMERDYLLKAYNHYHVSAIGESDIVEKFAGVRPLLYSTSNPSRASREYAIERTGKLITVFGGKWTTSLSLAKQVSKQLN